VDGRVTGIFAFLFVLLLVGLMSACSSQRAVSRKPSHPERKGVYHIVEKHQTLYRICKTYGVDIDAVASLNRISDRSKIQVGQRLFISGARKILKVDIYIEDVVMESREEDRGKEAAKERSFLWPVRGELGQRFEEAEERRHLGIDIRSPSGTSVKAAAEGVVIYAGNTIKGYGNLVLLRHTAEYVTVYAHHQSNLVGEGMRVEGGQTIGTVGQTGRASGPHLHFEIRKRNRAVDPLPYLN